MSGMAHVDSDASSPAFGELLRAHRRRAGLTQQALAQLATVSSRTIRDLELGRVQARQRTVRLIADGLGLSGLSREAFLDAGRRHADPVDRTGPALDTEPPNPADPLIGRTAEVRTILQVLESGRRRAIFVLGLGGVGKSRAVLEVARRLHRQRRWPVLWVPSEPHPYRERRGQLVPEVRALFNSAAPDSSRLCRLIGSHDVLLVLDDVFRLTPTMSGLIQDMLGSCPGLRVVVTSRAALAMPGALPAVLGPLPVPPGGPATDRELAASPSVQLLLERLASLHPGWSPGANDLVTVARLCRRLDGLPVALEIAAYQHAVLSLTELAALPSRELLRLSAPVGGGGEPTSLLEVLRHSCQGLTEVELDSLRVLGKLEGSWDVNDAENALGRSRAEVANCLALFTRLGMVRRRYDGQGFQFELLNLVREYVESVGSTASEVPEAASR